MMNTMEIVLISLIGFVLVLNFFLFRSLFKIEKRIKVFFKGKKGKDLETLISNQIKDLRRQENDIKEIFEKIDNLKKHSEISFQKIGMKRYNPFGDVGGDQSFTITLMDKGNNGFVVSSLYSKEGSRVYAKRIKEGKSEYSLTEEEMEVISQAIKKT